MKYKEILENAKVCKSNVEEAYTLGISSKYAYYFAHCILKPKSDVKSVSLEYAPNPIGTHISRQIPKNDYIQLAKDLISFVDKKHRLPNHLLYKNHKIRTRLYCYMFAKIIVYYNKNGKLPGEVNVNYKAFTEPHEQSNKVYDYFVQKTRIKPTTLDGILDYVAKHFHYQYYYDDHKSNREVMDTKSGNCTDLLQWLCNMVEPLGYEWKCIHVQCKSGGGHVYGKFRHKKHTDGNWIVRDIACIAKNGNRCVWCSDGTLIDVNPQWWMDNLRR